MMQRSCTTPTSGNSPRRSRRGSPARSHGRISTRPRRPRKHPKSISPPSRLDELAVRQEKGESERSKESRAGQKVADQKVERAMGHYAKTGCGFSWPVFVAFWVTLKREMRAVCVYSHKHELA